MILNKNLTLTDRILDQMDKFNDYNSISDYNSINDKNIYCGTNDTLARRFVSIRHDKYVQEIDNIVSGLKTNNYTHIAKIVDLYNKYIEKLESELNIVAENGHFETVKYLIEIGAPIRNFSIGMKPLVNQAATLATKKSHIKIVDFLIEKGARIDFQEHLDYFSSINNIFMVKYLCEIIKKTIKHTKYMILQAMFVAASNGHLEIIEYLDANNEINIDDLCPEIDMVSNNFYYDKHKYILNAASKNGHHKIIKYLIGKIAANISQSNTIQYTTICQHLNNSFCYAIQYNHMEIIDILLNDITFDIYFSAAVQNSHQVRNLRFIDLLLKKMLDVNHKIIYSESLLRAACLVGNYGVVKLLLDDNSTQITFALKLAIKHKQINLVRELTQYKGYSLKSIRNYSKKNGSAEICEIISKLSKMS